MYQFLKQYVGYSLGIALSRLLAFLLIPIYTRFFTPSDYGTLDVLLAFSTFVQPLMLCGVDTAVQILFFNSQKMKNDQQEWQSELVITCITLVAVVSIVLIGLGILASGPISKLLLNSTQHENVLRLLLADTGLIGILSICQNSLRLKHKTLHYNMIVLGQILLTGTLNIINIVVLQMGIYGFALGVFISDICVVTVSLAVLFAGHRALPRFAMSRSILKLGLSVVPTSLAFWVLSSSDRIFLAQYSSLNEVGIYGLANRLATAIAIFTLAIQIGWRPYALSIQMAPHAKSLYAKVSIYYLAGVGMLGLLFASISPLLIQVFSVPAYAKAVEVLPLLIYAQLLYGSYYIVSIGLLIVRRTQLLNWMIGLAMLINVSLNFLLIPKFGALGAATSTAVAYGVGALGVAIVGQHYYPLDYKVGKTIIIFAVIIASYVLMTLRLHMNQDFSYINCAIVICCSSALILVMRYELWHAWQTLVQLSHKKRTNLVL